MRQKSTATVPCILTWYRLYSSDRDHRRIKFANPRTAKDLSVFVENGINLEKSSIKFANPLGQ
jgi:DNA primase catalytic subunit